MKHTFLLRSQGAVVGACALMWLGFIAPAGAVLSISYQVDPAQEAYAVSSTDLINSGSASLLGSTDVGFTPYSFDGGTSTTAALNDGLQGIPYVAGNGALSTGAFDADGSWTTTFFLTGGFTIDQIETYASWPVARSSQGYTVSLRSAGSSTFTPLTTIDYTVDSGQSSKIVISDDSGPLASNVDAIRFDFFAATGGVPNTESVYREIDVTGTAVPEPCSLGLLALGGAALVVGRLRKR